MPAPQAAAAKAAIQREIENEIGREAMGAKGAAGAKAAGAKMGAAKGAGTATKAVAMTGKGAGAAAKGAGIAAKGAGAAKAAGASKGATGLFAAQGLSVGSWMPIALGVVIAAIAYKYIKGNKGEADQSETDLEIQEALG